MQKRVSNAIRGLVESDENPIVSIHDHGAGGHLNCLSELVEETGGLINLDLKENPFGFIISELDWGGKSLPLGVGASKKSSQAILENVNYAFFTVVSVV